MKHFHVSLRRFAIATAFLGLIVAMAPAAQASFTYSVAPATSSTNFGAGSTLTVTAFSGGGTSGTLSGTQNLNLASVTITTTTAPPATDTGTIALAPLVVTINNQNGGGSGTFTVAGDIVVTRSDTGGTVSSFTLTSIIPSVLKLGSWSYSLTAPTYSGPTVMAPQGSLGITIMESAVPEPASMALMGIGVVVLAGYGLRRKRAL